MSTVEVSLARFWDLLMAIGWLALVVLCLAGAIWFVYELRNPMYVDDHENPIQKPHD